MFEKFRSKFQRQKSPQDDARALYYAALKQARLPVFYGESRVADNYDGRIDLLTLHLSAVFHTLQNHGEQGGLLSQALLDIMKDDFEVAMREEGLSDSGIARRIKPMVQLFYDRLKKYTEALEETDSNGALSTALHSGLLDGKSAKFSKSLTNYVLDYHASLSDMSLNDMVKNRSNFPRFGEEK